MAAAIKIAHRNSPERAAMLADRAVAQRALVPRFTRVPSKTRLSTRGEAGQTWRTKAWTASRRRDVLEFAAEALDRQDSPTTKEFPNHALAAMEARHWSVTSNRLVAHLSQHPNDNCADAALVRLAS